MTTKMPKNLTLKVAVAGLTVYLTRWISLLIDQKWNQAANEHFL